jgi:hypothetical protein
MPQGHNNTGELFARSKPVAVTANKGVDIAGERIIITKKQAEWRSRHEGTDIAASYYHFFSEQANSSGHGQRGRRHRWRANNNYKKQAEWRSRHEGIDIAGELKYIYTIFFYNIHGANHRSHSHERAETAGELPQREQSCQKARRRDGGTTSWGWSLPRIFRSRASNDSVDENSRRRCSLRRKPRA